jgi:hypothetical protein
MRERIDIIVPENVLAENVKKQERLEKTYRSEPVDRTPVVVDAQLWGMLQGRGGRFSEMLTGPREHLRGQILNRKWRIETLRDDRPVETKTLVIESDFGALRGIEFPVEIVWNGDEPAKVLHLIQAPEEIDRLQLPDPEGGLTKTRVEWYRAMRALAGGFDVRLNGEPLELEIELTHPGGPFPSAYALCGSNLFLWMKTDPDRVHRLMDLTTRSHLQVIAYFASITGREPHHSVWLGADTAEMVRVEMFREMIAPYYLRVWEQHAAPRVFHMCGKIDHLLPVLRDDFKVDHLDGFGFPTDRRKIAAELAGRMVLRGGPHPLLIHSGPRQEIISECMDYIQTAGRAGGYILSEGFGLMAGTPLEHIEAMVEASLRAAEFGPKPGLHAEGDSGCARSSST